MLSGQVRLTELHKNTLWGKTETSSYLDFPFTGKPISPKYFQLFIC